MRNKDIRPDFFISHSKETKYEIAIPFFQALTNFGFDVWLDRNGILVGNHIYAKIEDAIERSSYCIAVIDKIYLERAWTIKELQLFHEKESDNILPIFVNIKKEAVYNKIPWMEGIAFEYIAEEYFNLNMHINTFCRIVSRYFLENNVGKIENLFEELLPYDFPCKNTLLTLIQIKEYYSQDFRLAIIALCNIESIIYSIYTSISKKNNKLITAAYQLNNLLRNYCFNINNNPNYNLYVGIYNSVLASIKELINVLQNRHNLMI